MKITKLVSCRAVVSNSGSLITEWVLLISMHTAVNNVCDEHYAINEKKHFWQVIWKCRTKIFQDVIITDAHKCVWMWAGSGKESCCGGGIMADLLGYFELS